MKERIKQIQRHVGVAADGIIGPRTVEALCSALSIPAPPPVWPSQSQVRSGNSCFGKPGNEQALTSIVPPYPLYYEGQQVRSIRVHALIASHVLQALREVLAYYGQEAIHRLGLDVYGGSYSYRTTSAGKSLSMHAWGIALDFAPEANAYSYRAPRATLSCEECRPWWEIWESHGATSLGRTCGYDWMHLQFANLS